MNKNTVDLRYFFDPQAIDELRTQPFNFQGKTIAGNGKIIIAAPIDESYKEYSTSDLSEPWIKVLAAIAGIPDQQLSFLPDDFQIPTPPTCPTCMGTGKVSLEECPECAGAGAVFWQTGNHQYSSCCHNCHGSGEVANLKTTQACPDCNGIAKIFTHSIKYQKEIFGVLINTLFFYPFKNCQQLRIAPSFDYRALLFSADKYTGLLLGIESTKTITLED